jgi:crotonobetainyl-CoA:carnitine CoA-transferase CaiB-like acyl-CoA transferase
VRFDGGDALPTRAAPRLGEDTDALLGELGYSPSAIAAMRGKAAVA